ncbi:hypothetical protein VTG60DRAFT_4475 [Thermothelomyces hinnuleus]
MSSRKCSTVRRQQEHLGCTKVCVCIQTEVSLQRLPAHRDHALCASTWRGLEGGSNKSRLLSVGMRLYALHHGQVCAAWYIRYLTHRTNSWRSRGRNRRSPPSTFDLDPPTQSILVSHAWVCCGDPECHRSTDNTCRCRSQPLEPPCQRPPPGTGAADRF